MSQSSCPHTTVYTSPSPLSLSTSFKWPAVQKRLLAATRHGKLSEIPSLLTKKELFDDGMTFPAPLVLPDDDLTMEAEPQTVSDWSADEDRNPVTACRRTIYVVPSPDITKRVRPMQRWLYGHDRQTGKPAAPSTKGDIPSAPSVDDICDYIRAFFHGLSVKPFSGSFCWAPWDGYDGTPITWAEHCSKKKRGRAKAPKGEHTRIGLETPGAELVGVRCRPAPDGASAMQVNLDDVLDTLLDNVPTDAYAIIMLLDLDMYEADDGDDEASDGEVEIFTGGRAYGGSRIAAVNCYREHPEQLPGTASNHMDGSSETKCGEEHWWPAAHCAAYVQSLCGAATEPAPAPAKKKAKVVTRRKSKIGGEQQGTAAGTHRPTGPLAAAIAAAETSRAAVTTTSGAESSAEAAVTAAQQAQAVRSDWLARLTKTATHELGHCLGLDHCTYYACIAQGCASAAESLRQPAYLCPVCLEKLGWAILEGVEPAWADDEVRRAWAVRRDEALRAVCRTWAGGGMFDGLAAWLDQRLLDQR